MARIDFTQKLKDLHNEMCRAIAELMNEHDTREVDVRENENRFTANILKENKFTDDIENITVETVKLKTPDYKDLVITATEWNNEKEEINLYYNSYVIPCSIINLYNAVYDELENK